MGFSQEWDEKYKANTQMSIWPWSDLVSYVMRYARPAGPDFRVLELGCGAGANIPFFLHLQAEYYAIEGSETIVKKLRRRFPELAEKIAAGDFTKEIPFEGLFDLVIDRSSLTHNSTTDIKNSLWMVYSALKPGGKYIGIDWFSTIHSDFAQGVVMEDRYSRGGFTKGQFADVGIVHFSDKGHLEAIFQRFQIEVMELKTVRREIPGGDDVFASWNLVAVKS